MKKLIFTLFISIISINFVYADEDAYISNFYDNYATLDTFSSTYSSVITDMISYYNTNLSSDYSYYYITNLGSNLVLYVNNSNEWGYKISGGNAFIMQNNDYPSSRYIYNTSTSSIDTTSRYGYSATQLIYSSNTDIYFKYFNNSAINDATSLTLPSYSNLDLDVSYPQMDISNGDIIPTYQSLTTGTIPADFTTVNLSSYDYIILSLKDYSQEPFNTTIYTQGSLCFTPVYNYGMQQKQDTIPGYQTAGCTEVYSSYTPVNVYIIQSDLTNHAVYYIKRQQNIPTTLKIPTSIFDITYINANNTDPQVVVSGRSYPVIPFNDLTDTANKSTDDGYVSGRVCSLGDVNCQAENMGMDISDLFTSPLTLLQTVWSSITSIFTIIAAFIGVLPPTLQVFLYTSFMLALIIGIIKIIL